MHFLDQLARERPKGTVNEPAQQVGFADKVVALDFKLWSFKRCAVCIYQIVGIVPGLSDSLKFWSFFRLTVGITGYGCQLSAGAVEQSGRHEPREDEGHPRGHPLRRLDLQKMVGQGDPNWA